MTTLHFNKDETGKYVYVPEPDESAFLDALSRVHFWNAYNQPDDVSAEITEPTFLAIMPEWLRDVIAAIAILGELLITRFMKDGKWVPIKWHRIAWNFTSLVLLFKAARQIIKLFKNDSAHS